jgi:phosphohistidine phosphatase SixA
LRDIGVEPSVEARPGLAPNDPVVPVARWLRAETEYQSLALVGHMPFLGRLASLLVVGDNNNNNQVASCWPSHPTLDRSSPVGLMDWSVDLGFYGLVVGVY